MGKFITNQIFKLLYKPPLSSHKGENGHLLIIAGSKKYHGSLLYAVQAASRIVDLIYVLSTRENQKLVKRLRGQTAEFISVNKPNFRSADAILIGPGLGVSQKTYHLTNAALNSGKKAVLDADSLNMLDKKLLTKLNQNHILTPHAGEFQKIFKLPATKQNLKFVVLKYGCTIILKGSQDYIGGPLGYILINKTGNAGMTKGGSGDVLAGLVAALFCKNPAQISSAAGCYTLGLAGDQLYKRQKYFYNSEDLTNQLPKTLYELI